ncbi:MAG: hypothetical protein HN353_11540 [Bdellovibrionales bacterium]|nr:hypothetical protein [Bdellovibrionales bacterium]MBT3526576.1 hypothetical protein [Bdellovibrionales bacterium]MBT7669342.1 hypothetical protein [Bdellovibrionales bacterium]MBT7766906.1 hypothetical protein [Bdellovibrionales bacterium]
MSRVVIILSVLLTSILWGNQGQTLSTNLSYKTKLGFFATHSMSYDGQQTVVDGVALSKAEVITHGHSLSTLSKAGDLKHSNYPNCYAGVYRYEIRRAKKHQQINGCIEDRYFGKLDYSFKILLTR